VITCEAVAVLPQASVAINVLVRVYSLVQVPGALASVEVIDTLPQASLAVGVPNVGVSGHSMVAARGTEVNTGAVLSSTVITCEAVAVLPQASVAINVLVRVYSLVQVPGALASVEVIDTLPQASLAVGVPNVGVSGHSMVAARGTEVNTGAVLSSTVITCEAVAVLPQASVAINVLVRVYSLVQVPGALASVEVIDTLPQASLAVGVPNVGVSGHSMVAARGTEVNTGAVLSSTVITCEAVAVLPQASVAINVLVRVYSLVQVPGALASVEVIDTLPQASLAVGVPNVGVSGHSMVAARGTEVNTGAVLSSTVITCEAVAVLPQASVAINVLVRVYSLVQVPGALASVEVIDTLPQASLAVGVPNVGVSGHSMVAARGTEVNTGAVLSSTVITCEAVAVLPQASVAINVLVRVYSLVQVPGALASVEVIDTLPQASLAVGVPNVGVSGHSMVAARGTEVNTGAVLSSTVITCEAVAVLPQASVAINVLVRVYSLVQVPGALASVEVIDTLPQASLAVGVPNVGVSGHSMVAARGTEVNTGAVLSSTVITCEAVAVLPQASVAINVLVRVYSLVQVPGALASVEVIDTLPQASLAVGVPNVGVSGHSMVAARGTEVNTGAVLSSTVITCEAVAVLPQASVAINVLVRVYSLVQVPGALASVEVIDTLPQASLAVGVQMLEVSGHSR
jgi:uncharacterized protein YsxB (DUF464 family)